jgi:hypothetical protein
VVEPRRIQRKRTRGWKAPEGAVSVCRPGKFGNPFTVKGVQELNPELSPIEAQAKAVHMFDDWISERNLWWVERERRNFILNRLSELRGKTLMCFCAEGDPCHGDVLLRLANVGTLEEINMLDFEETCAPCPVCKAKDNVSREISGDARFIRCACGHVGPKATTDAAATAVWNELAKGIAQREAGTAIVTDRFPDSGTPQVDVKDWVREIMQKHAEAGIFLPVRHDAVVKTEGVA